MATMRQLLRAGAVVTFVVVIAAPLSTLQRHDKSAPPDSPLTLWYRQPANEWVEALPIGNGRLAGMVFGGIERERIQLNEDTLWAGGPYDPANPQALEALPIARRLIFAGKYGEAHALVAEKMLGRPVRQMPFQPVGDLLLTFPAAVNVDGYRRELDLDTAVARVTYVSDGVRFVREVLSSPVDARGSGPGAARDG